MNTLNNDKIIFDGTGKIFINNIECNDPFHLWFTAKDRSEQGYMEINLGNELQGSPVKRG